MLPACWPSLRQLMGGNWVILCFLTSLCFFGGLAQREGRKCAHPLIKTPPGCRGTTCTKVGKLSQKTPLQDPLWSPRAMSCHTTHSTHHVITLTGIGADSVMHKGVQTAYACARAFKNCVCCRERALRRSYTHTPSQAFYSQLCTDAAI